MKVILAHDATSPHLFCSQTSNNRSHLLHWVGRVFNSLSSSSSFITLCHRSHQTDWPGQWIQGEHITDCWPGEMMTHRQWRVTLLQALMMHRTCYQGVGSSKLPCLLPQMCYAVSVMLSMSGVTWVLSPPSFLPLTHDMTHTFVYIFEGFDQLILTKKA